MTDILIVDDEEPIRFMLRLALEKAGYTVHEADTGRKAVLFLSGQVPDLMITDIIMPDKEGIETIIEAKNMCPDLPIIAMSGGGRIENKDYLELADKFGAKATFQKPFDTKDIVAAVRTALAPQQSEAADRLKKRNG